jgi:hypothetical protein
MKNILSGLLLVFILVTAACKKGNDSNGSPGALSLIQHKWQVVSVNGEALRYVGVPGDYYDFRSDLFLYTLINTTYDTLVYRLLFDNETLRLYPVKNNIRSNDSLDCHIEVLDDHQFILTYGTNTPPVFALDSLRR